MGFHENPCSGWQSQEAKRNMGGTTRYSRAWENISQPNKTRFKCEKQAITQIDVSYPGASQFEVARIRSKKRIQLQVPPGVAIKFSDRDLHLNHNKYLTVPRRSKIEKGDLSS